MVPWGMDREPEENLWIAVIDVAMLDATLGVSGQIAKGNKIRPYKPTPNASGQLSYAEIRAARKFIKGETRALRDIAQALDMDYEPLLDGLLRAYRRCMPYLAPEWQDYAPPRPWPLKRKGGA